MTGPGSFATPSKSGGSTPTVNAQDFPLPPSKSFSAAISDFWKPNKEPFLKWMRDLPIPEKQEKPLEPAHYHALKHALSYDDSDDESNFDHHRHKRAKMSSAASRHPTVESRRRKLVTSGVGLVRRVSSACRRVSALNRYSSLSSHRPDSAMPRASTPAPEPTPSPGTPSFALIDRPKMRFVFVGDSECGKTSMLLRFYRDTFTLNYSPTHYELYNKLITVNGQDTDLELWDTSGNIELGQLARLNYLAWDAVFLCFSVSSMRSFNNASTEWINHIRHYTRGAPIILVGTKTDQRVGASLWAPLYPNLENRVTATEGAMTADTLGATRYVECSAKTGQGIDGVFVEGVRAAFDQRAAVENLEKKDSNPLSNLVDFLCFK